jgi:leucyl-tRNA---protein transferase
MTGSHIRLYQTIERDCGYWPQRRARDLLLDPHEPALAALYPEMLALGFRRSGNNVYRPRCPSCRACVPLRVEAAAFRPSRSQRRCLARNADLQWRLCPLRCDDEHFALYARYLAARHPGGGMDTQPRSEFEQFLAAPWSPTACLEARVDGRLVAVAVTDVLPDALSAVYSYFDPDQPARGLGTAALLAQLAHARDSGRRYVYLGFWLEGHPKMDYKSRFAPAEVLHDGRWQPLAKP